MSGEFQTLAVARPAVGQRCRVALWGREFIARYSIKDGRPAWEPEDPQLGPPFSAWPDDPWAPIEAASPATSEEPEEGEL